MRTTHSTIRRPGSLLFIPTLLALTVSVALAETAPLRAMEPAAKVMPAVPAAPGAPGAPAKPAAPPVGGKVLETMDAGNYTYVRVGTTDGEKWIAAPKTAVKVGDAVECTGGMPMENFTSKTLGKTFETIIFADSLKVGGATAAPAAAAPHGAMSGKATEAPDVSGIKKAEGGLTVGEVYDRRAELDGKEVLVRGKVMKFNAGVMKRNWLHLRDGSSSKAGENDLTVTSDSEADVGDTVLVRGKLALNRDFGFNYKYDVLLEEAKVTVESE